MMDVDEIAAILGADGPFAREVPNFAPRPVQQKMARAVAHAIDQAETLVAEAGTGTGKTFAYLVPALLSGKRVIISTGTKTLQDQLFHRDLPRVREVLGIPVKASLLKGRANYLCRYRLQQTLRDGRFAASPAGRALPLVQAWAARTTTGDRMELTEVPESSPIWPRVTSTVENCLGSECPFFDDCFVFKARRKALESDVVVVNHHLLLADMALKAEGHGEILPPAQAYIIDEAHQLPELAGQFFSQTASSRQASELVHDTLAECGEVSGALDVLREPLEAIEPRLRELRVALMDLPERGAFAEIEQSEVARVAVSALLAAVEALEAALLTQAERSHGMTSVHARAQLLRARLKQVLNADGEPGDVRWYEVTPHGFRFSVTPLDIATPLRRWREDSAAAWIFTSATLSVAGRFDHFANRLGLDDPVTMSLPSPFDFQHQTLAYLPPDLPDPRERDYTERMVAACIPVLEASRGRAFFLFTSHRALQRAAELLAGRLPYPLLVQGTQPRAALLTAFRKAGNAVLLGAASFWEGVDVAGEALSCVIIDKLPFAAPGDPVQDARFAALRAAGENPFTAWQVPAAAIALKQGVGRLIRDASDRGVLVLCDPRLLSKPYGRLFLKSLPALPETRDIADVVAFFAPPPNAARSATMPR